MIITLGTVVLIFLLIRYLFQKKCTVPSGPLGLPYFGNVFQLEKNRPHKTLMEWTKKHGDIFRIKMFGQNVVVLNGYDIIYEAMIRRGNDFAGRPPSFRNRFMFGSCDDIIFTSFSQKWIYMKKITMSTLKMYGDNMINLERLTLRLIEKMLVEINEVAQKNEAFNIVPIIHRCTTAIITSLVYGKEETKEKVAMLADLEEELQIIVAPEGNYAIYDYFPWLRFLPLSMVKSMYKTRKRMDDWYLTEIFERKEKYLPGDPQCFLDGLFDEQRIANKKQSDLQLSNDDIKGIIGNIIFAGTATTSETMGILVTVLVNRQDVQQNIANEISRVIQRQPPSLADRSSFPYTEATILEILRYSSIVPLNLPHYTMLDTNIGGYYIPKDTKVLINLWNLHHSEDYWDSPWSFQPERFLDKDGQLVSSDHINRKRLLPFGGSRRVCPGENFARNRLFLLLTSLIQSFKILPESPDKLPDSDPRSFTATIDIDIPNYKVNVVPR